jgi:hypothetical protein
MIEWLRQQVVQQRIDRRVSSDWLLVVFVLLAVGVVAWVTRSTGALVSSLS